MTCDIYSTDLYQFLLNQVKYLDPESTCQGNEMQMRRQLDQALDKFTDNDFYTYFHH